MFSDSQTGARSEQLREMAQFAGLRRLVIREVDGGYSRSHPLADGQTKDASTQLHSGAVSMYKIIAGSG